jgi:hypothetical protein
MTDFTLFLDPSIGLESFEQQVRQLTKDQQLELQAEFIQHSDLVSQTQSNEVYLEAFRRVQSIDKSLRPPLASEITYTPDPSDSRPWRAETRLVWRLVEGQAEQIAELRRALSVAQSTADRVERELADSRRTLLRVEVQQALSSLRASDRDRLFVLLTKPGTSGRDFAPSAVLRIRRLLRELVFSDSSQNRQTIDRRAELTKLLLQKELELDTKDADALVALMKTQLLPTLVFGAEEPFIEIARQLAFQQKVKTDSPGQARSRRGSR